MTNDEIGERGRLARSFWRPAEKLIRAYSFHPEIPPSLRIKLRRGKRLRSE